MNELSQWMNTRISDTVDLYSVCYYSIGFMSVSWLLCGAGLTPREPLWWNNLCLLRGPLTDCRPSLSNGVRALPVIEHLPTHWYLWSDINHDMQSIFNVFDKGPVRRYIAAVCRQCELTQCHSIDIYQCDGTSMTCATLFKGIHHLVNGLV